MKKTIIHWLLIALALSLPLWLTPNSLTVTKFTPADVSRLLTFPLLVALFLERALEVFVNTWRSPQADLLDLQLKQAKEKLTSTPTDTAALNTVSAVPEALLTYRAETRRLAMWAALILGFTVSAIGIRTLQPLIEPGTLEKLPKIQVGAFRLLDVFLTGGLIAGGSQGIHKITQVFSDFMDATSEKSKKQAG